MDTTSQPRVGSELHRRRLGEVFVELGFVTGEQLDAALEVQRITGGRVGEILIERGSMTRLDLASDEIKERFEAEFPPQKITLDELEQFLGMLHRSGLILASVQGQGTELLKRRSERRRKELLSAAPGWTPGWEPTAMTPLGYPAESPAARPRKALADLVIRA